MYVLSIAGLLAEDITDSQKAVDLAKLANYELA